MENYDKVNADMAKNLDAEPETTPFLPDTLPLNHPCWNGPKENNTKCDKTLVREERFGLTQQLFRGQTQSNYSDFDPNPSRTSQPSSNGDCVNSLISVSSDNFVTPAVCSCVFLHEQVQSRNGFMYPPRVNNYGTPPLYPCAACTNFPPQEIKFPLLTSTGTYPEAGAFIVTPQQVGCVLMVHKLDPMKANPDKLFNLFCLYGNVYGVVFLKQKQGCAMIQMGDINSVHLCIYYLKNMPLWGNRINVGHSKKACLTMPTESFHLSDQSPSHKDYSTSVHNRFYNAVKAGRNRIEAPSSVIFFYNAPADITEEQLLDVLKNHEVDNLPQITIFPPRVTHTSGLFQFEKLEEATSCLVNCNNLKIIHKTTEVSYILKLSFTSSRPFKSKRPIC